MKKIISAIAGLFLLLTGAAHAGTWTYGQISLAYMTHGYMAYEYLTLNYTGTGTKVPLLVYEHQNSVGNPCYNAGGGASNCTTVSTVYGNPWFNTAGFASRYCPIGCIVLAPYADQTSDPSGQTSNFGGYGDTPGTMNNEKGVAALIHFFLTNFNVDPNRIYVTGDSLGGIGAYAMGLDYGVGTGTVEHLVTGVMPFSGSITRTPPAPPTCTAPAQACAAGFNVMTFGPAMTLNSNWFPYQFQSVSAGSCNCTQSGANIQLNGNGNFNASISPAVPTSGNASFTGTVFGGGGYFEVTMAIQNTPTTSGGWPAFWGNAVEGLLGPVNSAGFTYHQWPGQVTGYSDNMEVDGFELQAGQLTAGMHNWYSNLVATQVSTTGNIPKNFPGGTNLTQQHRYGWLWVPATASTQGSFRSFFDDVESTGLSDTWNLYNPALGPPPTQVGGRGGGSAYSVLDVLHVALIVGTGPNNPMTVSAVKVWQASSASNITH